MIRSIVIRRLFLVAFAGGCLFTIALAPADASDGSAASADPPLSIAFAKDRVDLVVGDKFALASTITNTGSASSPPVIAHLNVASLTSDVYVDPEDWSSGRSKYLPAIEPGQSMDVTWDLQAVNSGWFDVYVVLLPRGSTSLGSDRLVVSHAVLAKIAGKQTANPGGALPSVVGIPIVIGGAALWSRWSRRSRYGRLRS